MELWKEVKGYEGRYAVSTLGRVRSLTRTAPIFKDRFRTVRERILNVSKGLYPQVSLYKNNVPTKVYIHQLMAIAFLGHVVNGHKIVVDHIDNNPKNNTIKNLQLITQRENVSKEKRSATGVVGVYPSGSKFMSQIAFNKKAIYLGTFKTIEEASKSYQNALTEITENRITEAYQNIMYQKLIN
jgi:hypothetical protein